MIRFLIKGLIRDPHRSLFPIIVVAFGVMLTTVIQSWINGEMNDLIDSNARFDTGHLKIVTQAYEKLENQMPNDLSLANLDSLTRLLNAKYSDYEWTARIKFVGLLDLPDSNSETKSQTSVFGLAADLFGKNSNERNRLSLEKAIVKGRIPSKPGEIIIGDELFDKIDARIGNHVTLLSTSSNGSLAVQNFVICGTVKFGIAGMDRGALVADLSDMQYALEMTNGATEILGFNKNSFYNPVEAEKIKIDFNNRAGKSSDQFSPVMATLGDQNSLNEWLQYVHSIGLLIVGIFMIAMSIVLLNSGLMSGIRRYGEVGVRLALGEAKGGIYKSLLYESLLIGVTGSILGTLLGLAIAFYLQTYGIDINATLKNSSIMMPTVLRARINYTSLYIGFIPGVLATLIGTTFSGRQIFKRQTASLFKELE
jgi:putative ABC transport system permease protein